MAQNTNKIIVQKIKRKNERNGFNYEETKRRIKIW